MHLLENATALGSPIPPHAVLLQVNITPVKLKIKLSKGKRNVPKLCRKSHLSARSGKVTLGTNGYKGLRMVCIYEMTFVRLYISLCTRKPKIRLLHDASAARKPKIKLRGLPIINN